MISDIAETLKAWAAGFVDGEGYIGVQKCRTNRHNNGFVFSLAVGITQANKKPLELIQKHWGGRLYIKRTKGVNYWGLDFRSRKAAEFIKVLLPYFVVKKEEAETAIEFQRQMFNRGTTLTKEEYDIQVAFYEKLRALKSRNHHDEGVNHPPCEPEHEI